MNERIWNEKCSQIPRSKLRASDLQRSRSCWGICAQRTLTLAVGSHFTADPYITAGPHSTAGSHSTAGPHFTAGSHFTADPYSTSDPRSIAGPCSTSDLRSLSVGAKCVPHRHTAPPNGQKAMSLASLPAGMKRNAIKRNVIKRNRTIQKETIQKRNDTKRYKEKGIQPIWKSKSEMSA